MHSAEVLIEFGAIIIGLAILARVAGRFGIPAIPLYLLAGLAFGKGGIPPLVTTAELVRFSKAKFLGIHTPLSYTWDPLPVLAAGDFVSLVWSRDRC